MVTVSSCKPYVTSWLALTNSKWQSDIMPYLSMSLKSSWNRDPRRWACLEAAYPYVEKVKCPSCKGTTVLEWPNPTPPPQHNLLENHPTQPAEPWEIPLVCTETLSLGYLIILQRLTESGLETSTGQWLLDLSMFLRMHYFKIKRHPSKGCGVTLDNTCNQQTQHVVSTVSSSQHRCACFTCPLTPHIPIMCMQILLGFPS